MSAEPHNNSNSRYQAALDSWRAGDTATAESMLSELLEEYPTHQDAALLLAKLYQTQGWLGRASEVAIRHCRATAMDATTTLHWAQFIQQCQRQGVAAQLCEEAIELGRADAELYGLTGNILCELGRFDEARKYLLTAIEHGIDLNKWFVHTALADTRRYTSDDDADITRIEEHFNQPTATPQARAASGFALAKILDDLGNYERAAQTLDQANALARQALPWSGDAWQAWIAQRISNPVEAGPGSPARAYTPVFIVGMPRTGTTLAASKLGRYRHVRDRGELPHISYIARRLIESNLLNDAQALAEAAQLYDQHVRQDDEPARWYIDKNPENIRYLDLVAALFPDAKIVICRRNRADTALSMWRQYFAHPDQAYSYDFDDMATFFAGNDALLAHWRESLQVAVFELDYEQFVSNPDQTLQRLREFIGMDPEHALIRDPQGNEAIASSSRWQARQAVHGSSIGRWRNYQAYIPQLERFSKPKD